MKLSGTDNAIGIARRLAGIMTVFAAGCAALASESVAAEASEEGNTQTLAGEWKGTLKITPQTESRLVMHLDKENVVIDSPDQGAFGIPGEAEFLSQDSVSVAFPKIMARFNGKLTGSMLDGVFTQGLARFPLQLERNTTVLNRPQTPQPPFPYSAEDMTVQTKTGVLAGTLTLPEGADAETPLVIMVTGSGPQNRDEEIFEHKPFAVIADYLARNGIASFRYDDLGTGESTGDFMAATTADFANDAQAVIDDFRKKKRFGRIGILGHSEGGLIGYRLGAKPGNTDFVISIAGPSIKGSKILAYQNKHSLLNAGVEEEDAEDFRKAIEAAYEYKTRNPHKTTVNEVRLAEFYPQYNNSLITLKLAPSIKAILEEEPSNPWMMYFLGYDPAADLKALKVPALILYGGKDTQVPAGLNEGPARSLAPSARVVVFPDQNHLMQTCTTGEVGEYKEIEETISPTVLTEIAAFIKGLPGPSSHGQP